MAVEKEVMIRNPEGLHFRPIMQFVDLASRFKSRVQVLCAGREADGRSPMELLMLVATQGSTVTLVADGHDAQDAVEALTKLVESGFGEM